MAHYVIFCYCVMQSLFPVLFSFLSFFVVLHYHFSSSTSIISFTYSSAALSICFLFIFLFFLLSIFSFFLLLIYLIANLLLLFSLLISHVISFWEWQEYFYRNVQAKFTVHTQSLTNTHLGSFCRPNLQSALKISRKKFIHFYLHAPYAPHLSS